MASSEPRSSPDRTVAPFSPSLLSRKLYGFSSRLNWVLVFLSALLLVTSSSASEIDRRDSALANGPVIPHPSVPTNPSPKSTPSEGPFPPVDSPDSAQQKLEASKVPLNIAFAGLALYSVIGLATLVAMIFPPQNVTPTRQSQIVQRLFSVLVIFFCLLRLVYFCFPIAHVSVTVTYIVNQLCFMVFFTMFSLIIFFWAEQYHRKFYNTQSMLPRLRNLFIGANILLWTIEIILVVLSVVLNQIPSDQLSSDPSGPLAPTTPSAIAPMITRSTADSKWSWVYAALPPAQVLTPSTNTKGAGLGGPLYFASVIAIVIVDFIFAIGFAIYGIAIVIQKYRYALGSGLRRELITTMIVTCVFAACFALRMTMFLYRPITGKFMNATLYRVLAYFIPEVVAVLLQISVVYLMHHGASRNATGWGKRGGRSGGGSFGDGPDGMPRPSIEDDVYYPHDLRASSMPAPRENAHERLISPPRPLRQPFSTPVSGSVNHSVPQSVASSASSNATPALNNAVANISAVLATGPLNASSSSLGPASPPTSGPSSPIASSTLLSASSGINIHGAVSPSAAIALQSGLPHALATHSTTRIGGTPINIATSPVGKFIPSSSFSPSHDQPLMSHSSSLMRSTELPLQNVGQEEEGQSNPDDSESSDYEFVRSDSSSLISPSRRPKQY